MLEGRQCRSGAAHLSLAGPRQSEVEFSVVLHRRSEAKQSVARARLRQDKAQRRLAWLCTAKQRQSEVRQRRQRNNYGN